MTRARGRASSSLAAKFPRKPGAARSSLQTWLKARLRAGRRSSRRRSSSRNKQKKHTAGTVRMLFCSAQQIGNEIGERFGPLGIYLKFGDRTNKQDCLVEGSVHIQFWGTRGSIATPGSLTARYGGNTSCVEVRSARGTLVVLDCGTGARPLGRKLMSGGAKGLRGNLLISHTHWDHIQGIPFFAPLFVPGNQWDIYGPKGLDQSLRETLAGQMQYTYFPVTPDQFGATIHYHDLVEGTFDIDDIKITTHYLNHPALTLGYRLEADGATIVYCSDHEPHSRSLAGGHGDITGQDLRHAEFLKD